MKITFTFLSLLVATSIAFAQAPPHTFKYENGPKNPVGTDVMYGTVLSSIAPNALPQGEYWTWDVSDMVLATYQYSSVWAQESSFPNATHSNIAYVDIAPGVQYQTKLMMSIDNSGIKVLGEGLERQAFSLNTSNPNDSIVVLKQNVLYSQPQVRMPYPATIYTKWNSTSTALYDLTITYNPLVQNEPAQRKTITTSTQEVVGWGFMQIKRPDGKPSSLTAVLQVKHTLTTRDSFFVSGAPAPAALLAQAGIQQGETNTVYQRSFFREYEIMPLLNVTYETAAFSTMKDVTVHSQRLPFPESVEEVAGVQVAEIYPNPNNGSFSIKLSDAGTAKWSYSVVDMVGKTVAEGSIKNQEHTVISLDDNVARGTYIVQVYKDGTAVSGQKMQIQ